MSVSSKRLRALPLAVAVAAAIPLVAPVAANAAMAGAPAATTTLRPDLRSATLTNYDASTGIATVRVCFDKNIASVPDATKVFIGEYNGPGGGGLVPTERQADSAIRVTDTCFDATWNTADTEPAIRTYVRLDFGAVASTSGGVDNVNLEDSVGLQGSNTHNGTAGHTDAPDLEGVQLVPSGNFVRYIFDQKVDPVLINKQAANWKITTQFGLEATALDISPADGVADNITVSGNVVQVAFFPSSLFPPAPNRTVRASVGPLSVVNSAISAQNVTWESADVPGTGGQTDVPDLLAVDVSNPDQVDYVFDETIVAGGNFGVAGDAHVALSDGLTIRSAPGPAAWSIVNGNTVRIKYPDTANVNEYLVWGDVAPNIVHSATTGNANNSEGELAGDNKGAFATGFTTGPDAMRASVDTSTGVVSIRLDQRFNSFSTGDIFLVDDAGSLIPGNPTAVSGAGGPAGQVIAKAQFTPGQVAGAKSLLLDSGAFRTADVIVTPIPNVDQLLGFSATAKYAKKNGKTVWTHPNAKKASKKAMKRFKALRRAVKRH